MHKNTIAFVIVAAIGGFIGGFWLANSINRSAVNAPAPQNTQSLAANSADPAGAGQPDLTSEELKAKIAEADNNPSDFAYQRDLGVALYRYAALKQDVAIFNDAVRILDRAHSLNAKSADVLITLGNAHFDIGFYKKDAASFQRARDAYQKALAIEPNDADVQTDFGLTYFLQEPPAYDKAVAELSKVATADPRHERSLQFLVQTYVKQGKLDEADKTLAKIKNINPANTSIAELTTQIAAARSTPGT